MAQQAHDSESLHETLSLEHKMDLNQPNGNSNDQELVVGPGEVCKNVNPTRAVLTSCS